MQLQQPRVPSKLVNLAKGASVSSEQIQEVFERVKYYMIYRARVAQQTEAKSYNHHLFGASILAHDSKKNGEGIFAGGNIKPTRRTKKRHCAERSAIERALESYSDYDCILAIVIIGPPKADDHSGFHSHTTLPCIPCCDMLAGLVRPDTIVYTISSTTDDFEQRTWEEVLECHESARAALA